MRGPSRSAERVERCSTDPVHVERLAGPVSDQIDAGIAFVAGFMRPSAARGSSTETVPAHDLDGVDEAIVNAVARRDYAIAGSKIRLFFFADRLELYSPGKPPNTITLADMPYRTFTRNQLLVSFLSRLHHRLPWLGQLGTRRPVLVMDSPRSTELSRSGEINLRFTGEEACTSFPVRSVD